MTFDIIPGTRCMANGRVVDINGMESSTAVSVRDVKTGAISTVPISKIDPFNRQPVVRKDAVTVPDEDYKRAARLLASFEKWKGRRNVPRRALKVIAKEANLSVRQVQRARQRYRRYQNILALLPNAAGRRGNFSLLDPRVEEVIRRVIRRHYLKREGCTKIEVFERCRTFCLRAKLVAPSKRAVYRRIERLDQSSRDWARGGKERAKQRWQPRPGQLKVQKPLDMVQIDHTRVDVIVVSDDEERKPIGRPWITLAIDVATRCVVGMYLTMKAPSSLSVAFCLEHAVLPKVENEGTDGLWPMYGLPKVVHADNGPDLRSQAVQQGAEAHGIELQYRPVKTPHYGAHIERLNGTLMRLCHLLPGTTFSNTKEKADYQSVERARFTLDELRSWLVQKICRYYHVKTHRGLDQAPLVAWERAHTDRDGKYIAPPLVADPQSFRLAFMPFEFRKVQRTGIELNRRGYWHDDLAALIRSPDEALVRFDPRDPSRVWVTLPDDRLLEVPCVRGRPGESLQELTPEEERKVRERLEAMMAEGFERTDAIEKEVAAEMRKARHSCSGVKTSQRSKHAKSRSGPAASPADGADIAPMTPPGSVPLTAQVWNL